MLSVVIPVVTTVDLDYFYYAIMGTLKGCIHSHLCQIVNVLLNMLLYKAGMSNYKVKCYFATVTPIDITSSHIEPFCTCKQLEILISQRKYSLSSKVAIVL